MGYYCIFITAFSYCWKLIDFYIVKWAILTSLAFLYAFKPKYTLAYRFNKMSPFPMLGVFDSIYKCLFQYSYRTFYKQKSKETVQTPRFGSVLFDYVPRKGHEAYTIYC